MARTKTTTPSNKKDGTHGAKSSKAKKKSSAEQEPNEENDTPKPLQATIGEALMAKGARPANEVQVINFDRRLPCTLTHAQVTDRGRRMKELRRTVKFSEAMLTTEKEEWDKKKKSIETDIARASADINNLADEIGDEAEYRDVRCQRVFDYKLMQVREVRTDTSPPKQLQEPRAMTARECEEGYTLADGEREVAPVAQPQSVDDDGSGIVDDNYGSSNEKNQDLNTRPEDFA